LYAATSNQEKGFPYAPAHGEMRSVIELSGLAERSSEVRTWEAGRQKALTDDPMGVARG